MKMDPPYHFYTKPQSLTVAEIQALVERCEQAERNMMVMMSQWEIAISKMEERFQQVEKMVEDLKKIHAEAQATRDDMNYFLSLVKIPSQQGKEEEDLETS